MQKRLIVLIVFIAIFAVFLIFIMLNLDNKCDISFGFTKIPQVPVFLSVSISFILGLICAIPLVLQLEKKHKEGGGPKLFKSKKDDGPSDGSVDALSAREKFLSKRRGGNDI